MSSKSREASIRWAAPWSGLFIVIFSALGLYASVGLLMSELQALTDPDAHLACDLNPLIGCSSSLLSPQAHLLIMPNSALGLIAFGAMFALGAVLMFGGGLPRVIWWGFAAGSLGGLAFVVYFLYESVTHFKALCPFCMVTWAAVLGVLPIALGGAAASGALGGGARPAGKSLLKYSWALVLILYMLVLLVVLVTMADKLKYLF